MNDIYKYHLSRTQARSSRRNLVMHKTDPNYNPSFPQTDSYLLLNIPLCPEPIQSLPDSLC